MQLDQRGVDPGGVVSLYQYLQDIATIARTEAQHRKLSLDLVQGVTDIGLDLA
jgi:hypothetical protein